MKMDYQHIVLKLQQNKEVFISLLNGVTEQEYTWKPQPEKWCMLEVICHLYDEEINDFRMRLKYLFERPGEDPPKYNTIQWVMEHRYMEQDFQERLSQFLDERDQSIHWLRSLSNPPWDNYFDHPKMGPMSGHLYISNWLAHDYLHMRQIARLKYDYLKETSGQDLKYAGNW